MARTAQMKIAAAIERNKKATPVKEMHGHPTEGRNERRKREITRLEAALAGRNKKGGTGGRKAKPKTEEQSTKGKKQKTKN